MMVFVWNAEFIEYVLKIDERYHSEKYIVLISLPRKCCHLFVDRKRKMVKSIPRDNTPDKLDIVKCVKHFPVCYATVIIWGEERPKDPPLIFPNIRSSLIHVPAVKPWETKKSCSAIRSIISEIFKIDIQNRTFSAHGLLQIYTLNIYI